MRSRLALLTLLALVLALAWALPALAQEARTYWRHSTGHFENTAGNRWIEKHNKDSYTFVERDRTPKFIELYDRGRECTVRLFDDRCMVRFGNGKFERYYDGRWVR
jgi:hypothetical protein